MRVLRLAVLANLLLPGMGVAGDLALKRVMLSTGGVGYVEYEAAIDGTARVGLDVPLAQVDDVLASLVVFDSAGGIGGLELPGRDDTAASFGNVPFGPDALGSPLAYLNSLQGVVLEVHGPQAMTGRLLAAESVPQTAQPDDPKAGTLTKTRVSLLTDVGLRQFILEDADSVQVADPALRDRVTAALASLQHSSSQTMRHITLQDAGTGPRTVRVGYVASMALWKTSYRLVLPQSPATGTARLQGWAVLENGTGADWNGVQLTLQYGNPVTLHQSIYRQYFVQRPDVPVEILGRLLPDIDTRATTSGAEPAMPAPMQKAMVPMGALPMPPAPPVPVAAAGMAAPSDQVAAAEGAEDTVFSLPTPVVLPAGHTASVPILDRAVKAERIGLVQQGRAHPLATVKITNDSGSSLPAGILTLYDAASPAGFAGDARLGGLPAGESRLLSFAEDLRTAAAWTVERDNGLAAVTAADGVLHVDRRQRWTAHIHLAGPANDARSLLVEIPKSQGTVLTTDDGSRPVEETAGAWRLAVSLKPGESRELVVHVDRMVRQDTALLADDRVVALLLGDGALSPRARAALQHVAELRTAEAARRSDRDLLTEQVAQVNQDEARLRQNLAAIPPNDALRTRLVRQVEADEDRLAALAKQIDQAGLAVDQAHQALATAVQSLQL